jgi:hypothetical protein
MKTDRDQKYINSLSSRISVLERALARIHFITCENCGEMYPPEHKQWAQFKGGCVCWDCVQNDEDLEAKMDLTMSEHEAIRLNALLADRWRFATVERDFDRKPLQAAPGAWHCACVVADLIESSGLSVVDTMRGIGGRRLAFPDLRWYDPRNFRFNGSCLVLKQLSLVPTE